jgi:hypothetical protein
MSAANPDPMERSMVLVLVVANAWGGSPLLFGVLGGGCHCCPRMKCGGINVQIVLGNGNLGLTIPMKMRGERQGGAARRLAKKGVDRERGTKGRGKDGREEIISAGNKGGEMVKNGRERVKERGEPGAAASV